MALLRIALALLVTCTVARSATSLSVAGCQGAVTGLIADHLGVEKSKVVPRANLEKDLGADDLDQVELVLAMEELFKIEIPDDEADRLKTIGDMVAFANRNAKAGCR